MNDLDLVYSPVNSRPPVEASPWLSLRSQWDVAYIVSKEWLRVMDLLKSRFEHIYCFSFDNRWFHMVPDIIDSFCKKCWLRSVYRLFKIMSTIASHSPLNISENVRDRDLVPTSKGPYKWPMGNQMITWPMTSCDPKRLNLFPVRLED